MTMKRIQTKITLTYLILAVVIIAAVGVISSLEIESLFEDRLVHQLEQQADVCTSFSGERRIFR